MLHVDPSGFSTGQVLENSFAVDPMAVKNPQAWVQSWTTVITAITKNSVAAPRIIISPLGNPDARGLKCVTALSEDLVRSAALLEVPVSVTCPAVHLTSAVQVSYTGVQEKLTRTSGGTRSAYAR